MQANLVVLSSKGILKTIALPSTVTVVGRRRNCDLRIPVDSVSKRHCQFALQGESLRVRDLGSRNGTYVNGERVEEHTLKPGDVVGIGPVLLACQINGQPEKIQAPAKTKAQGTRRQQTPKAAQEDDLIDLDESGGIQVPDDLGELAEMEEGAAKQG